ncbi:hypothetical protein POJ06DRAFT_37702 [Lipomyces tetrasporus]|uniref:Essential protein Yae1 N-terminal domain-containing protein n=1 Tax=Lipomyces tetrasporus TaxID=54092 RepID=A0AAD7QKL9_9ASCO|nr:uncharacterized protein POJ06DRAFT_37702 [Lipomyces tetrasporus]KAJ8096994.1 hypothetical protein POJ06DRAFT_37702 [Lipomyces tetrasporus]
MDAEDDLFDSLLSLESSFYQQGYDEGLNDGLRSGTSEGKQFGLQTGFQRFVSIGILQGRCRVWSELGSGKNPSSNAAADLVLLGGGRSTKQLQVLTDLVTGIPTENTMDAVEDYENRFKRARARAKVVVRLLKDPVPVRLEDDVVQVLGEGDEETIEDASGIETTEAHDHEHEDTNNNRAAMELEIS